MEASNKEFYESIKILHLLNNHIETEDKKLILTVKIFTEVDDIKCVFKVFDKSRILV